MEPILSRSESKLQAGTASLDGDYVRDAGMCRASLCCLLP